MANDDVQEQMREWMEAAQKPQPPLSNTELRKLRLFLDQYEKTAWLKKRIFVMLPWAMTLLVSAGAGWKYVLEFFTGAR